MRKLKVRFTIEHRDEQCSFASLSELKQHSSSNIVIDRLNDFEIRLKHAAAYIWLQQRLGRDIQSSFQIAIAQNDTTSELTGCTPST